MAEAHRRGLELHAWFNPYRARHPSATGPAAPTHISVRHPELVRTYGTYGWMDPGEPAVMEHTLAVMLDVVRRYDVDGVHIDDYFYPYPVLGPDSTELPFPDSASYARYRAGGGTLARDDWRRHNVDTLVREMDSILVTLAFSAILDSIFFVTRFSIFSALAPGQGVSATATRTGTSGSFRCGMLK